MLRFLVFKSLRNRKFVSTLCVTSIALSLTLFLLVEKTRDGIENGFTNSISNADLVVGARSGSLQLLLYSIFHIGSPTNNITIETYEEIKNNPAVKWTIPISLGDSYQGYRVVATNQSFFKYYQFHGDRHIKMANGKWSSGLYEVAVGAIVAKRIGLKKGDKITLSHGLGESDYLNHKDKPFVVSGILKTTGTPVDKSLYITLEGMEAIHLDARFKGKEIDPGKDIKISQLTAFILRTKNRIALLQLQRFIGGFEKEPLSAIIPAMTLVELWNLLDQIEKGFLAISILVILVGFCTMLIVLYMSLNERQREMVILRSIGCSSRQITLLFLTEAAILSVLGGILGIFLQFSLLSLLSPLIEEVYAISIEVVPPSLGELKVLFYFMILGTIFGVIPALKAYRMSAKKGLVGS